MSRGQGSREPRSDSLATRLLEFYRANPDEEMTRQDIADKFGVSLQTVSVTLHRLLVESRELEYVQIVRLRSKGVAS